METSKKKNQSFILMFLALFVMVAKEQYRRIYQSPTNKI